MDKINFQKKICEVIRKRPRIFALDQDNKANVEMIEDVEKYYDVKLPESYKDFVSEYGGGYFGFIVVYSCDYNGIFYIKENVQKEWVLEKAFLPVIDLETGDLLGFEIINGMCESVVTMYLHEENKMQKLKMDFYDVLLKYGVKYDE